MCHVCAVCHHPSGQLRQQSHVHSCMCTHVCALMCVCALMRVCAIMCDYAHFMCCVCAVRHHPSGQLRHQLRAAAAPLRPSHGLLRSPQLLLITGKRSSAIHAISETVHKIDMQSILRRYEPPMVSYALRNYSSSPGKQYYAHKCTLLSM
jgi:hypothetical protein